MAMHGLYTNMTHPGTVREARTLTKPLTKALTKALTNYNGGWIVCDPILGRLIGSGRQYGI